eukprot:1304899-Rhodomonas_salina.1
MTVSAYAPARRSPILTVCMGLPGQFGKPLDPKKAGYASLSAYTLATRCPVLTWCMMSVAAPAIGTDEVYCDAGYAAMLLLWAMQLGVCYAMSSMLLRFRHAMCGTGTSDAAKFRNQIESYALLVRVALSLCLNAFDLGLQA